MSQPEARRHHKMETNVNRYKVLASDPQNSLVALVDSNGDCHLARATATPPTVGEDLLGEAPAVGLRALRTAVGGDPCPVVMVLLTCDHAVAARVAGGELTP